MVWLSELAGQRLFRPPNVAGWDETRWLDTSTFRGRWACANEIAGDDAIEDLDEYSDDEKAGKAVDKALRYWGDPTITHTTHNKLVQFANKASRARSSPTGRRAQYRGLRQNALRHARRHLSRPPDPADPDEL